MKNKKYYAYLILKTGEKGVAGNWDECAKKVLRKEARFRAFDTEKEAEEWLGCGAEYEKRLKPVLKKGIYFDSGTGRGLGVEINVSDESGNKLLTKVMPKKLVHKKHETHFVSRGSTNNYGELLACFYALKTALKSGVKKIFGDSKLVINFWSKGIIKKDKLGKETLDLIDKVYKLRNKFEKSGGEIKYISGDDNPADLGFH
ncbi:MAG: ribonuclease H family protein [Candidatus Pacebacteria bacterium]|nr:ribonuclease H family protein [Candidatus Paceibacterota bacterium]